MASNPTARLSSLLASSTIEDHEEVLKAVNAVLKASKSNQEALHTRVVALLKLDRFEDALRAFDDGGDKLAQRAALEKAYALYKTGQLEDANKVIQNSASDSSSRGLKHVAAQVAYRAENFEDAATIYKTLSVQDAAIEGEENDLRINSAAVDAQLQWQGKGDLVEKSRKKHKREDLEAFETAYNAACGYIARGEFGPGSVLLRSARDLCEALDELTDEEKKAEVLPIMVQQAYVFTRMGKVAEAEALQEMIQVAEYVYPSGLFCNFLIFQSVPELPTRVVAQNNALAADSNHENPFLSQKTFDSMPTLSKTEKLFEHQASIMRRNRYVVDLQTWKFDGVGRSTAKILSQNPSPTSYSSINSISAINAAAYAHCQSSKAGLKQILPLLEKRPTDVGLLLTIIQLYLITNNSGPAITLLETFFKRLEQSTTPADLDVRFAPGLVALLVSLYKLQGRKTPIQTELGKAASHWRKKSKPSEDLLKAAGISLLESSKLEDLVAAGDIFDGLRKQDPTDRIAIAGFVASNATINFESIQSDLDKLTPVEKLVSGIDAAALEDGGIASLPLVMSEISKKRPAPIEKEKPAKKKIRQSKLPKEFEEEDGSRKMATDQRSE
jgi:signal recognition particle subunit SRP72